MIDVINLKKSFGETEVLKDISVTINKGDIVVVLGPSGSGKSTLLNIIGGIDSSDSGYIAINGEKTADMDEKTLTLYRRKHLGYVFQMYNLIPNLNIKENVEVGAYLSDNPLDVDDLLKTLGLYEHRHKLPNQLSGGQQQRVSVARALVNDPKIIFADEPTGALDSHTSQDVMRLMQRLVREQKRTLVMVTHDRSQAEYADRVLEIIDGKIVHITENRRKEENERA